MRPTHILLNWGRWANTVLPILILKRGGLNLSITAAEIECSIRNVQAAGITRARSMTRTILSLLAECGGFERRISIKAWYTASTPRRRRRIRSFGPVFITTQYSER